MESISITICTRCGCNNLQPHYNKEFLCKDHNYYIEYCDYVKCFKCKSKFNRSYEKICPMCKEFEKKTSIYNKIFTDINNLDYDTETIDKHINFNDMTYIRHDNMYINYDNSTYKIIDPSAFINLFNKNNKNAKFITNNFINSYNSDEINILLNDYKYNNEVSTVYIFKYNDKYYGLLENLEHSKYQWFLLDNNYQFINKVHIDNTFIVGGICLQSYPCQGHSCIIQDTFSIKNISYNTCIVKHLLPKDFSPDKYECPIVYWQKYFKKGT